MRSRRTTHLNLIVPLAGMLAALPAAAAESSADQTDDKLEVILVTATKRSVDVEKLPEAVTAITADQLDNLNAVTFEDYFRTVPGLMMNEGAGRNRFDYSLRGISSFSITAPPTSATVGEYYDEIPMTAVGQQIDPRLVDIDRIEVLRGPQGTYFGEDSLGGTIRVITKKPILNRFAASTEARLSETQHGGTNDSESIMVNIPLVTDKLALRANYFNALDSGFIDAVSGSCTPACTVTGVNTKQDNPNRASGERAMLLFQPLERVSILTEFIHSNSVANGSASYELNAGDLQDLAATPGFALIEQDNLYNLTANVDLGAVSLVSSSSWGYRTINEVTGLSSGSGGPGPSPGPGSGGGGSPVPTGNITNFDSVTEELRLVSSQDGSARWDYIVGGYFSRQSQQSASYGGLSQTQQDNVKDKAGFGELGYKFTSQLNARLGVRHQTVDFVTSSQSPFGSQPDHSAGSNTPTTGRVVANYDFNENTLAYASISKGFRKGGLNALGASGAPIPGIPVTFGPDTTTNYEFGWKFSFPSHKATLNGAFYHIDWKDIQVIGIEPVSGPSLGLGPPIQQFHHNAGRAKVDGFELEGGMELLQGLRGQASLSLMNPRISEDQALLPDDPANNFFAPAYCMRGCPARAGDKIPYVSRVSGSLTLSYRQALWGSGLNGFAALVEQYTGSRNTDFAATWQGPSQTPVVSCPFLTFGPCPVPLQLVPRTVTGDANPTFRTIPAQVLTNLQLGIENNKWRASAYVDNVFDQRNLLSIVASGGDPTGDQRVVSRPRTIGVWVRRNFD